jgi:hypothetical protein
MRLSAVLAALLALTTPAVLSSFAAGAAVEIYPAASGEWSSAVTGASAGALPHAILAPSLFAPGAASLNPTLSAAMTPALAAPVAAQLESALGLTPAAFAALPAKDKTAALELAVDGAREEVQAKAYDLISRALPAAAPDRPLDAAGRAELFTVVSQLGELRTTYAPLLDADARAAVEKSYTRALVRAAQVRDELIGRRAQETGDELTRVEAAPALEPGAPQADAPDPVLSLNSSPGALKLYKRMSVTTAGWGADDVDNLLTGYGFTRRDGKHRNYSHPDFPQLHDSYSHLRTLKDVYIKSALNMVRELARLRAAAAPAPSRTAGVQAIRVEDLKVLLSPAP